jgi:hypothetical protein
MLVIKVELHSAISGEVSEIARMVVDNIGGTTNKGDYRVRTLRGRSRDSLEKAMLSLPIGAQREARVLGHPRLREHVWNLVAKALFAMNYGESRSMNYDL